MLLSFPILVVEGFFFTDKKKRNGGVEDFHSFMSTYLYILPIATAWDQFYSHFHCWLQNSSTLARRRFGGSDLAMSHFV